MSAVAALVRTDVRAIRRDTLLLPLLVITPLLIGLVRVATPAVREFVAVQFGVDVVPHLPWALSAVFVAQIPFMLGGLLGLLVLDERDDGTLSALQVTPLGLAGYARYRLATAVLVASVMIVGGAPASGLVDDGTLLRAAPALLPTVLLVPAGGLAMLAFAGNKVEGLAVMKGISFVLVAPLAAWFVDSPWTLAFGVIPTYWPLRAVWAASAGATAWPWAAAGLVHVGALLLWLAARARRRLAAPAA